MYKLKQIKKKIFKKNKKAAKKFFTKNTKNYYIFKITQKSFKRINNKKQLLLISLYN